MEGDKAPGPDGFPIAFYKACWETVRDDLVKVVQDFYERGFLDKGSNATFISLIPKKEGVASLSDFRPVSLIGNTYKIISKCLSLRLKYVLPTIISKEQGAFMEARSILDGFLCASECIDDQIWRGRVGVICMLTGISCIIY